MGLVKPGRPAAQHLGERLPVAPLSAPVPVIMILFGMGAPTIVTVFMFAVWIIALDTRAGVIHVSPLSPRDVASFGASRRQRLGSSSSAPPCRRSSPASGSA